MHFLQQFGFALSESLTGLKQSRIRASLTIALIAIGLMSLVGVLTAIDSIQNSVTKNLSTLGAESFDIIDKKPTSRNPWLDDPAKNPMDYRMAYSFRRIYPKPKAVNVSFTGSFGMQVLGNRKKTNPNCYVVGSDESYLTCYIYSLEDGRNFSRFDLNENRNVAIIGNEIKQSLFPNTSPIGKRITLGGKQATVIGYLKKMPSMMGNSNSGRLVLLPINFARLMKKTTGGYTLRIVTSAATHGDDQLIARRILRNLKGDTPGKKDSFVLQMNESALSSLNSIGTTLKMGGGIIGFITILGASIGLLNIMIVSVKERTREIGVRKSLGATTAAIRLQFLMEAIMICLVGGAIGTLLGLGIGNLVPVLTGSDSFVIPYDWIILGFVTSVLVGVLSGYMPANSAARVDPVESLRYE